MSNQPISEQFRLAGKEWVEAQSAAQMLEEAKSAVLSQMMMKLGDIPKSRAEMVVKASDEWMEYITKMVEARKTANLLQVKKVWLEMRSWEHNSEAADRRAEMKL
ncbi:MAG: hypothetical protein ACM3IH_15020 [Sphingobacteriales bacterium]